MATRARYVAAQYSGGAKPRHRARSLPVLTPSGENVSFCVGRFLNQVAEVYLAGNEHTLCGATAGLRALPWFEPWLDQLRAARHERLNTWNPLVNAALQHVLDAYPANAAGTRPDKSSHFLADVAPGCSVSVPLTKWMTRFAEARGRGELDARLRARLEALPWACEWLAELSNSRASAARRRVLSKSVKIELLLLNCFDARPPSTFVVPVCGPGIEGVYHWRPSAWLEDIVDNWLRPERSNVRLDATQMAVLEKLPWVTDWVQGVRATRAERARRAALRVVERE